MEFEIHPKELNDKLNHGSDIYLLDVREQQEFDLVNLKGHLIPLNELSKRVNELEKQKHIVVYCHHGIRSAQAVHFLKNSGFERIQNLAGGIDLWAEEVDPEMIRY